MSFMARLVRHLGMPATTHQRPHNRATGTDPARSTTASNLGAISAPTDLREAIAAYNADNARDWGHTGGTCPICGHHGCFGPAGGRLKGAGRWACFSAGHGTVGVKLGACFHGDALDVDAAAAGCTRLEHLRARGYLRTRKAAPVRNLRAYFADFLRERRAVLVVDGGMTPKQANAEARRLLRVIQEREEGARHAR